MRHRKSGRKLSRTTAHRNALLRNLVISLILVEPDSNAGTYERIVTTRPKAKEARRLAEKVITLGKKGTLAARRRALALLDDKRAVRKVFQVLAARYAGRPGGYTRIMGFPKRRVGDNATQVIFELVEPAAGAAEAERPEVAAPAAPETSPPESEEKA
ncbi:MAG TPA: 50S ribosomal protein L17 [Planctomycetota bacterium]|nr:50S ribosomal protein L17 [Planctomycetota bacterium]